MEKGASKMYLKLLINLEGIVQIRSYIFVNVPNDILLWFFSSTAQYVCRNVESGWLGLSRAKYL